VGDVPEELVSVHQLADLRRDKGVCEGAEAVGVDRRLVLGIAGDRQRPGAVLLADAKLAIRTRDPAR